MRNRRMFGIWVGLWLTLTGCGGSSTSLDGSLPFLSYEQQAIFVIDERGVYLHSSIHERCTPGQRYCYQITRSGPYCRGIVGGPMDALYINREPLALVCYPELRRNEYKRVTLNWDATVQNNNQTILFDFSTTGRRFEKPLQVTGNDSTIYGLGPRETIFVGDSFLQGNNTRLRGVQIFGDLTIHGNNNTVFFTVVHGNLTIQGNNAVLGEVTVHGDLHISGNNQILMWVDITGTPHLTGNNYRCELTRHFRDINQNQLLEPSERGRTWTCTPTTPREGARP